MKNRQKNKNKVKGIREEQDLRRDNPLAKLPGDAYVAPKISPADRERFEIQREMTRRAKEEEEIVINSQNAKPFVNDIKPKEKEELASHKNTNVAIPPLDNSRINAARMEYQKAGRTAANDTQEFDILLYAAKANLESGTVVRSRKLSKTAETIGAQAEVLMNTLAGKEINAETASNVDREAMQLLGSIKKSSNPIVRAKEKAIYNVFESVLSNISRTAKVMVRALASREALKEAEKSLEQLTQKQPQQGRVINQTNGILSRSKSTIFRRSEQDTERRSSKPELPNPRKVTKG